MSFKDLNFIEQNKQATYSRAEKTNYATDKYLTKLLAYR